MLNQALTHTKTVAIGGHIRPDGDCVGSCMGLYLYLKENYPEVSVDLYLEDIPECFKGMPIVLVTAGLMAIAFCGFSGLL